MTTSKDIDVRVAGMTASSVFVKTVNELGDRVAIRSMNADESWNEITFAQYGEKAARVATALQARGIGRGDRVVLMIRNVPDFHWFDVGTLLTGATPVSIYNSSAPEQVAYLAGHCNAKVAVLENGAFYERFRPVLDQLPDLNTVIVLDPNGLDADVVSGDDFMSAEPADLGELAAIAQPDDLATIIYTSGTTGNPKGVMISHYNVCWTAECLRETFDLESFAGKRVVSYLPMAHIAERMTSHYSGFFLGYEVSCCPDPSQVAAYARAVRPNIMFGVPRVWEKVYAGVNAALAADPEKKQKVDEAVAAAVPIIEAKTRGDVTQEQLDTWDFLDAVAFNTIRDLVGLDQLDLAVTGAAPIPAELVSWFRAIGVPLAEIYGMSESSGPMTFSPWDPKAGSVGRPAAGIEVAIFDDGEVCCRGGNVFAGYLNDPEKTAEALDSDGWLHSGDIGRVDDDGYYFIIDRKKELIITAGGKNISPANLEAALKTIPLVGQACAVGDNRPFVAALVVLDPEVAPVWAQQHGLGGLSLAELADHPDVIAEVESGLDEAMDGFNNAERVKRLKVLGEEWMPDSDLLTPTSKLKRRGIHARYSAEIEAFYS